MSWLARFFGFVWKIVQDVAVSLYRGAVRGLEEWAYGRVMGRYA